LDIDFVVAQTPTAHVITPALGRANTLTVVPAPGATVWRSTLPTGELTVLAPMAAATATNGTATNAPIASVLDADPGSADVTVPAGAAGRLVVLAEPASRSWHASMGGTSLPAKTAYGWAQAFVLPAAGGQLHLDHSSGARHSWLTAEVVIIVVLGLTALPGRRRDDEELAA
jgi:hypothetical protein